VIISTGETLSFSKILNKAESHQLAQELIIAASKLLEKYDNEN